MRKIAFIVAGAAAIAASPALAAGATGQTTSNTLDVKLNVTTSCAVTTKTLDFGTVTSATTGKTAVSSTTVKCTPGAAFTMYVDGGKNSVGAQRKMKSTDPLVTDTVDYAIFRADGTTPWPTTGVAGVGASDGGDVAMTIAGQLTQTTAVKAAPYADTLTVTLDY